MTGCIYLENGKMKCHPCVNTRQNNPFSTGSGCTNFRNSTLVIYVLYFILICLNVSCLVNDHVYVIYVYNVIDIVQFYILFSVNRLNSNKTK